MIILAGIDGTGTSDNRQYGLEFNASNVTRAVRSWSNGPVYYQRGPTDAGLQSKQLADNAAGFVRNMHIALTTGGQKVGVFLTGYSRGAAAVIEACSTLSRWRINVDCLLLFDAVDRTHTLEHADNIPSNVRTCYHAVRDPGAGSRAWMGNCGRGVWGQTAYREQPFFCTHGGVGGVPWNKGGASGAVQEDFGHRLTANPFYDASVFDPTVVTTNVTPLMDNMMARRVWQWASGVLQTEVAACQARLRNPSPDIWPPPPIPAAIVPRPPNPMRGFSPL